MYIYVILRQGQKTLVPCEHNFTSDTLKGLRSAGQQNGELIIEKLHLIRKLKFRIFNSMAVIFYLSFHMLSYFWVIHNL